MNKRRMTIGLLSLLVIVGVVVGDISQPIVTDFDVSPKTGVSEGNRANISAYVSDSNLKEVDFIVVDTKNRVSTNSTVLFYYLNRSGISSVYADWWRARSYSATDGIRQTIVTRIIMTSCSTCLDNMAVVGIFKKNSTVPGVRALLWFNWSTDNLTNVSSLEHSDPLIDPSPLGIEDGNSTVRFGRLVMKAEGPLMFEASNFRYAIYGFGDRRNPHIISHTVPQDQYSVLVGAENSTSYSGNRSISEPISVETAYSDPGMSYDADGNGSVDKNEAIQAVMDYFSGEITRRHAIEVVISYFG